jgi:hypothetical protein
MKHPRYITRVDNESHPAHCWRVVVKRKGECIGKTFSDSVYGGKRKALKAAIEHLSTLQDQISSFEYLHWVRTRPRRNNTSGVRGVGRYETPDNPKTSYRSAFWQARWFDEQGVIHQRRFYVSRYGEHRAKLLAIAEREYQLTRVCALKASKHRKIDIRQLELDFGEEAMDVELEDSRRRPRVT